MMESCGISREMTYRERFTHLCIVHNQLENLMKEDSNTKVTMFNLEETKEEKGRIER